jgi:oligoendopeptidase F
VDEKNAERLMKDSGDYRYYLEEIRHFKPHTLTEAEEKIVNIKDVTGMGAMIPLYDAITNRYVFKLEVNGEVKELTRAGLQPFIQGPDAEMRAKAYQENFRVFGEDGPILGQMYQARVRDWHNENINLRKFSSAISVRNLQNDVPDEAVTALMETTKKNSKIFQRYFKMKAKFMGVDKLRRYDIYAPVAKSDKTFDFDPPRTWCSNLSTPSTPSLASWRNACSIRTVSIAKSARASRAARSALRSTRKIRRTC